MITGRQIQAARALLGWEATDLATSSGLSRETISKIENNHVHPHEKTLASIFRAFNENGVEFTENEGVRFRSKDIQTLRGVEGFKKFLDNVYDYVRDTLAEGKDYEPICSSAVNDKDFARHLGSFFPEHIHRMNALKGFKHQILLKEKPASLQPEEMTDSYREYRMRSPHDTANVVFYVYGDRLAILMLADAVPQIVMISSVLVARAYREIFNALWAMAKPFE